MSILENAIDSITLGVEDYQSDDPRRLMSAVRNFFAGILLLFKFKLAALSEASDEALIKQKVLPFLEDGTLTWKGEGKKTVDVHQIKERFKSLEIDVDWKRLESIQNYRNDIEHYYTTAEPGAVRQHLVDGFVIARDFIDKHLDCTPRDLLGEDVWDCLLAEKDVFDAEQAACSNQMQQLDWNEVALDWMEEAFCDSCGSGLIRPATSTSIDPQSVNFECSVCGAQWDYEAFIGLLSTPDGVCPECGNEGYVEEHDQCIFCGTHGPYECMRCQNEIPVEELSWDNGSLCGWCAHMSNKDD
jgi:DNA-directed RNA polymerase subunit RPC12/RpoP